MCQTFAWRTAQVQCRCEPWDWPNLSFQAAASDNRRWISQMAFGIRLMQLVQPGRGNEPSQCTAACHRHLLIHYLASTSSRCWRASAACPTVITLVVEGHFQTLVIWLKASPLLHAPPGSSRVNSFIVSQVAVHWKLKPTTRPNYAPLNHKECIWRDG